MTESSLTSGLIGGYIVIVIVAIWAYIGIVRMYLDEGGRSSPVWTALVVMAGLAIAAGIVTLPYAAAALLDLPRFPATGIVVMLAVIIPQVTIIVYRIVFGRIRARRGHVAESQKESEND